MYNLNTTKASLDRVVKHLYNISYEKENVQEKVLHEAAKSLLDAVNYRYVYEQRCCYIGRSFIEPDFLLYDSNNKITLVEFKKRGVSLTNRKIFDQVEKYARRLYQDGYDMSGVAILTDGRFYYFYDIYEDGFISGKPFKMYDINKPSDLIKLSEEFLMFSNVTDKISNDTFKMIVESGSYLKNDNVYETEISIKSKKCYLKFKVTDGTYETITAFYLPRFRAMFKLEDDPTYKQAQIILNERFN